MRRGIRGFTLLEVMVAMTVLALTMGAVIKAVGGYTANQAYLRDRTLAVWVARNALVEQQVKDAWPSVGELKGSAEMGGREWRWIGTVSQTDEQDLRRLDVKIRPIDAEDSEPIAVLSGFLRRPDQ
ncbi:MAG: type II secretion system minor pseudopilin GspI [Gammaproteobacteria bacterium]